MKFKINKKTISEKNPTYFIADIGANHDGSLARAKNLLNCVQKQGRLLQNFNTLRQTQ